MYPGLDLGFDTQQYTEAMIRVNMQNQPLDARSRDHLVSQYDGAIAYLDEKVGELIAHLKATGQFERTLIIITADHGESFGDRNILGHDTSVYEDQVHVPLIIKYPGQTHAERVETLVSHVDLMPTVLAVLGLRPSAEIQGLDLQRIARDGNRTVVAEMHGSIGYDAPRFQQIEWALYSGSRKLIYSDHGMREIYDLAADPDERRNIFSQDAAETAALRAKLTEWSLGVTPRYRDSAVVDRNEIKRLESLGYAHQGNN
jgi:arylsulfatase A-like enzyme